MQFQDRDSSDWGFQMAPEGRHLCVFDDNIRDHTPEDTSKSKSTIFPVKIIEPDPEKCPGGEGEGVALNIFAGHDGSKFSKRKFADLIVMSGLKEIFEKQFPGDVEPDAPQVIDGLKAKLPGKQVYLTIAHQKDKQGREQANVVKIEKAKKAPKPQDAKKPAAAAPTATSQAAPAGDGW